MINQGWKQSFVMCVAFGVLPACGPGTGGLEEELAESFEGLGVTLTCALWVAEVQLLAEASAEGDEGRVEVAIDCADSSDCSGQEPWEVGSTFDVQVTLPEGAEHPDSLRLRVADESVISLDDVESLPPNPCLNGSALAGATVEARSAGVGVIEVWDGDSLVDHFSVAVGEPTGVQIHRSRALDAEEEDPLGLADADDVGEAIGALRLVEATTLHAVVVDADGRRLVGGQGRYAWQVDCRGISIDGVGSGSRSVTLTPVPDGTVFGTVSTCVVSVETQGVVAQIEVEIGP